MGYIPPPPGYSEFNVNDATSIERNERLLKAARIRPTHKPLKRPQHFGYATPMPWETIENYRRLWEPKKQRSTEIPFEENRPTLIEKIFNFILKFKP